MGGIFRPIKDIYIETNTAHLTFTVPLPKLAGLIDLHDPTTCTQPTEQTNKSQLRTCTGRRALTQTLIRQHRLLVTNVNSHIHQIHTGVQTFYGKRRRMSRSFTSYWLSRLTGLADSNTVTALRDSINLLQTTTEKSLKAWGQGTSNIVAGLKLSNDRIDSLDRVVMQHTNTLNAVLRTVRETQRQTTTIRQIMAESIALTAAQSEILFGLGQFATAINAAMNGRLSPFFVNATALYHGLNDIATYLARIHTPTTILHDDAAFYYQNGRIMVTRLDSTTDGQPPNLVIVLQVPLTVVPGPLKLYEAILIPLAFPDNHAHILIADLPNAILYSPDSDYYVTFDKLADTPTSNTLQIGLGKEILHRNKRPSCIIALIEGDFENIDKLCDYRVLTTIPYMAIRLSDTQIFLSGYKQVAVKCDKSDDVFYVQITSPQLIYDIPCSCSLVTDEYILPAINTNCNAANRASMQPRLSYASNLPVLRQYFDKLQLAGIQIHTLLTQELDVQLPDLNIVQARLNASVSQNLAIQSTAQFNLKKIINASLQNERSYTHLAQWLLERSSSLQADEKTRETNERGFDFTSIYDWLHLALSLAGAVALGISLYTAVKVKILMSAMPVRHAAAHIISLPPRLFYQQPTVPSVTAEPDRSFEEHAEIIAAIRTYVPLEFTLILLAIIGIAFIAFLVIRRYLRHAATGQLIASIGNRQQQVQIPIMQVVQDLHGLVFHVTARQSTAAICTNASGFIYRTGTFEWSGIELIHENLKIHYPLPKLFSINCLKANRLNTILQSDYYMELRVITTEQAVHVVTRTLCDGTDALRDHDADELTTADTARPLHLTERARLYPDLHATTEHIAMQDFNSPTDTSHM